MKNIKNTEIDSIDVRCITCGIVENNSYIIINGDECVVIDPSEYGALNSYIECIGVKVKAILLTHGHYDHIWAVNDFQKEGIKVYVHESDAPKCRGTEMGHYLENYGITPFEPDVLLKGGEELELIGLKFKVIHTPGHSKGSVCYVVNEVVFSGDTLFQSGYGRYDFYDGSLDEIRTSLNTLFALDGEYKVYPGHGRPTKMSIERTSNMIFWS